VRTDPAPGSDPEPGRSSLEREDDQAAAPGSGDGNDARLRADVPPHY
jgi:hypothetical protein